MIAKDGVVIGLLIGLKQLVAAWPREHLAFKENAVTNVSGANVISLRTIRHNSMLRIERCLAGVTVNLQLHTLWL